MTQGQSSEPSPAPGPAGAAHLAGSELKRAVLDTAERVQEIIDAAEQAAGEIRDAAEREAADYLASRKAEADRLLGDTGSELTAALEPLVRRLEQMREDAHAVVAEVEKLLERTRPGAGAEPSPGDRHTPGPAPLSGFRARLLDRAPTRRRGSGEAANGPSIRAFPGAAGGITPAATEGTPAPGSSAGAGDRALLRATQMAVAGSDRTEIERVLRDELGIADPGPLVARVLGE